MAVAGRDAGRERQVGGDLPERDEWHPEHAPEHVLARSLADPVGLAEYEPRAPPDDRVRWVHHVEYPAVLPRSARGRDGRRGVIGEPHDPPVLIDGLHFGAARI